VQKKIKCANKKILKIKRIKGFEKKLRLKEDRSLRKTTTNVKESIGGWGDSSIIRSMRETFFIT